MKNRVTLEEKAEKYDALQTAIKFTIEAYEYRRETAEGMYWEATKPGNIAAYNKGIADTLKNVITDLRRWADE